MTNKLYETDSYKKIIDTVVTGCESKADGIYVTLAETIFFPEEGGQYADTGMLCYLDKEVQVLDGIIHGNSTCNGEKNAVGEIEISYKVSEEIPVGTTVTCRLDWANRYDRMQNHSGEHVLTGVIHNKYGYDNVGFHLSDDDIVTVDFDGILSYEQAIEMEALANKIIYDNLPIQDSYPTKEELESIDYRSKIKIDGQVRLITVGSKDDIVDVCACCAPHVAYTGEIGIIKVISVINWKGGVRLGILCGRRALEYINHEHEVITGIAKSLSTNIYEIGKVVDSYRNEVFLLKGKLAKVMEQQALAKVSEAVSSISKCVFLDSDFPTDSMKNIYNALIEQSGGFCGVFCGDDINGYRYNAGSSEKDSRELAALLREKLGAKGGGSTQMIQGKISEKRDVIEKFFNTVNQ